jgi:hypothetical protein
MSQSGKGPISSLLSVFGLGKRRKRRVRKQKGTGILDVINKVAKATKIGSTAASMIPVVGPVAGKIVSALGYGRRRKRTRKQSGGTRKIKLMR